MRTDKIKRITNRISKLYGMIDKQGKGLFRIEKGRYDYGLHYTDIYTELTSYEGGFELIEALNKEGYTVENQGGCIYRVFLTDEIDKY